LKSFNGKKGSLTVEAAIALPVFLCAVISIVMLARVVYTHGMIQHALNETADEIASAGYIYHISGIRDIHDSARSGIKERTDIFREQMDTVFDVLGSLGGSMEGSTESDGSLLEGIGDTAANPVDELKNIACFLAGGSFEDIKAELFTPVVKLYMKKYLRSGSGDADAVLSALNIPGGFDGLDFSDSAFLEDPDENIDIVVRYAIELPVPIKAPPRLELVQRATARAWLGGDEASGVLDGPDASEDIWALDNFKRGAKFRSMFGANLPASFPVIAAFEGGKAVMIKSMDLTAKSYRNTGTVRETIDSYIRELSRYRGQESPWGAGNIVIREADIRQRELLLIIPRNELPAEVELLLSQYGSKAAASGVLFRLERYGVKAIEAE
jgi:hypothetical protein